MSLLIDIETVTNDIRSVYMPGQLQPNASLPVVFWIHGGGYELCLYPLDGVASDSTRRYGTGGASAYSGQDIVKESDYSVIIVIIQYRLGVFGFLPGSEVRANGTLNVGIREYVFADVEPMSNHTSFEQLTKTSPYNGCSNMWATSSFTRPDF